MNTSPTHSVVLTGLICLAITGHGLATVDPFLTSHSQPPPLVTPAQGEATLKGTLANGGPAAAWRLKGESVWHASDETISDLLPGIYWLEFKPVTGSAIPTISDVEVTGPGSSFTTSYTDAPEPSGSGWVRVESLDSAPPSPNFWRIEGETEWHGDGQRSANRPCGVVAVEFRPFAGFLTLDTQFVHILPGQGVLLETSYSAENSGDWAMTPVSSGEAAQAPCQYVGLVHSSRGVFTGTAVGQYTVLTTLDAVYDPETGEFAKGVTWAPASHPGSRRPPPRKSAGFILMTDQPSELRDDDASKRLVAIYFTRSAADGGWSGHHVGTGAEWLSGRDARIIGYAGEAGTTADRGKIHASASQHLGSLTFQDSPFEDSLFTLPGFQPAPGLNGAALFTLRSNGREYPAAILIGRGSDATFRVIDDAVDKLIATAEDKALLDNGGTGNNGAVQGTGDYGSTTVANGHVRAVVQGFADGRWKLNATGDTYRSGEKVEVEPVTQSVELAPQDGFTVPEPRSVRVVSSRISEVEITYSQSFYDWEQATFDATQRATGRTGSMSDYDNDGTANILEWAFGLNPLEADSQLTTADYQPGLPLVDPVAQGGMTVQYLRRKSAVASGVVYAAEFSSGLGTWQTGEDGDVEDAGAEWERVTVTDPGPLSGRSRFARVAVTSPDP
jgi:hypothetical protein